jgi:hypothetical protein
LGCRTARTERSRAWLRDPPKLAKGEASIIDANENRRRRVRELKADLHRLESAPYPSADAKRRLREQIAALAQRGAQVSLLIEHAEGEIVWATRSLQSQVLNSERAAVAFAETPDTLTTLVWAIKDKIIAKLDQEIDAEADDPAALSAEARATQAAEVLLDLLDIERQESALVWRGLSEQLPCEHGWIAHRKPSSDIA